MRLLHRQRGPILLLGALIVMLVASAPAIPAARGFTVRYSQNITGDIALVGNTLETCPSSGDATCAAALTGTASGTQNDDNTHVETYVDIDGDASTFDSSSATLTLPATATVRFAGLYWGSDTSAGTNGVAAQSAALRGTVKLKVPGASSYASLTANTLDDINPAYYQGFRDITSLVQAAGNGSYTVANVQAGTGQNRYAGWSLIVAYSDATALPRNLTIFDGFNVVNGTTPTLDIPVTGFATPPAGAVNTRMSVVAYEGDFSLTPDSFQLNGTSLTDVGNPAANFMNSSMTNLGSRFSAKNPDYLNQLGYDSDIVNTSALGNGATSATMRLTTSGDVYLPGMVAFATQLYAPIFDQTLTKTGVDITQPGVYAPGDVIEYTISATNTGNDDANPVTFTDRIPTGSTYLPGSMQIASGANAGAKTDAAGDDQAEFINDANPRVVYRLGTGATSSAGGKISPTESFSVVFRVALGADANGMQIVNSAQLAYSDPLFPANPLSSSSYPPTVAVVRAPDFQVSSSHTGSFTRGTNASYTIGVAHVGTLDSSGTITVTDTAPAGLTPGVATGTGWVCSTAGQVVTCTRSGVVTAGTVLPSITVPVAVTEAAAGSVTNTVTVANASDTTAANDTATDSTTVVSSVDVSFTAGVSPGPYHAGQDITFTYTVTNAGPSSASAVTLADAIPASAAMQSFTTSQGTCSGTLNCALGTIPSGGSAIVTVVVRPLAAAGTAGTLAITATAGTSSPDSNSANDSATTTLTVTRASDLSVTGTVAPASDYVGENLTYTYTVGNAGPNDAAGVTLTDVLPAGVSFVSSTTSAGSCSGASIVTCTIGALANGATATVTVVVAPGAGVVGTLANSATVAGTYFDGASANDSVTKTSTVVASANLSVTTSDSPDPVYAGQDETYTVTISNSNLSPATGVTLTDTLPANAALVSVTPSQGSCDTASPLVCTIGTIAPGANATVVVVVRPNAAAATAGSIASSATVAANEHDPAPGNNTGASSTVVQPSSDITTTLSSTPGSPVASGVPVTYTATVSNAGPSSATGVSYVNTLPAGVTIGTITSSQGGACTNASGTITCPLGTIASGASATVSITVTPTPAQAGTTIRDTATTTATEHDPDASGNTGVVDLLVTVPVNLGVTMTSPSVPVYVGAPLTSTVTVTNGGPSPATGVVVTSPLPAGTSFDAAASSPECTLGSGVITCTVGALANGANAVRVIVVTPGPTLDNGTVHTAVTAGGDQGDPTPGDNTISADTAILPSGDLSMTMTAAPATALAGQPLTYTLTVTNNGPSDATGVVVSDVLPAGPDLVSSSAGCTGTSVLTCAVGTLASGASATIVVTVRPRVADVGASITNSATSSSGIHDPQPSNDSATSTHLVAAAADLTVSGSASSPTATPGNNVTVHVDLSNAGPSTATGAQFVATVPAGVTVVSAKTPAGDCAVSGSTITCPVGSLASGGSSSLDLVISPTAAVANSTITVNVAASANEADPAPGNSSVAVAIAVGALPSVSDLHVTVTIDHQTTAAGTTITWMATLVNYGPATATEIRLTSVLPAGATIVSIVSPTGTCTSTAELQCSLSDLASGATTTVTVTLRAANAGPLTTSVSVVSAQTDPTPNNVPITATILPVGGCTIVGTDGKDVLRGTPGNDVICGRGKPDKIYGLGGNDIIYGDGANDVLYGGRGKDKIYGGTGNDTIYGGNGNDKTYGGKSRDRLYGGNGKDLMVGGTGSDRMIGGKGNDQMRGGAGNDRIAGGKGNDRLNGNVGKDRLDGGKGNDRLYGGGGSDTLKGSRGHDRLSGGKGADKLSDLDLKVDKIDGGPGIDTYKVDLGLDLTKNVEIPKT